MPAEGITNEKPILVAETGAVVLRISERILRIGWKCNYKAAGEEIFFFNHGGEPPPGRGKLIPLRNSLEEHLDLGTTKNKGGSRKGTGLDQRDEVSLCLSVSLLIFPNPAPNTLGPVTWVLSLKAGIRGLSCTESECPQRKVPQVSTVVCSSKNGPSSHRKWNTNRPAHHKDSMSSHHFNTLFLNINN